MDFAHAEKLLTEKRGDKTTRKLAHNTYLQFRDRDTIAIRLHQTDVVTLHRDNTVILNSGGWRTVTTKERINRYLPFGFYLYQEDSIWYVVCRRYKDSERGVFTCTFQDGMRITPEREFSGAGPDSKELRVRKRRIQTFAKNYINALYNGEVGKPSGGDCWICLSEFKSSDHIEAHIEEEYFVPTLIKNALFELGSSMVEKSVLGYLFGYHDQDTLADASWVKDRFRKVLTRYIYRQMGFASYGRKQGR